MIYKLAKVGSIASCVIWLLLLLLWFIASNSTGDKATALGFIFLLAFIFISVPLWLTSGMCSLISTPIKRWLIIIFVINSCGHILLAHSAGFFDSLYENIDRQITIWNDPALAKLRLAIVRGPVEDDTVVRQALSEGADPNAVYDEESNLPLIHLAAMRGDLLSLAALIEAGADINRIASMTISRFTNAKPIDLVLLSANGRPVESMRLLIEHDAELKDSQLLNGACFRGDSNLFSEFEDIVNPHMLDNKGYNCIHIAVEKYQLAFLETISGMKNGSDWLEKQINLPDKNGTTPFDLAVMKQTYEIAHVIYQAGGRPNRDWTYDRIHRAVGQSEAEKNAILALRKKIPPQ